jgi:hypothetical protein
MLVHLYPASKRSKYNKYREAWHLLLNATKGKADGPIRIQACSDEEEAAQGDAREAKARAGIRKMFRPLLQA